MLAVWGEYAGAPLDAALGTLRAQDVPVRIVLVDNASEAPVAQRPETEIVRSSRRLALGAARNLGIERVTTPFLVMWDADDEMLPGTIAVLERGMAEPGLAAYGAAILEGPNGPRHRWPRPWIRTLVRRPLLLRIVHSVWSVYPATGATIMRTELVRDAGGYPPTDSGEDWVLGVSLAFRGRLGWTERPGRLYRRHADSVWALRSDPRHLRGHAHEVRRRIREDAAIGGGWRSALPLIAVAQHAAVLLSRTRGRRVRVATGSRR